MSDSSNANAPLSQNEALEVMGRFLNLANSRGAFNLLEAEQVIRAISVFRVAGSPQPAPAPQATSASAPAPKAAGSAPVSTPTVTTI